MHIAHRTYFAVSFSLTLELASVEPAAGASTRSYPAIVYFWIFLLVKSRGEKKSLNDRYSRIMRATANEEAQDYRDVSVRIALMRTDYMPRGGGGPRAPSPFCETRARGRRVLRCEAIYADRAIAAGDAV